jgi:hypothetical protein
MVSWAGPTPGIVSRSGSALHALIVMTYEGSGVLQESTEQRLRGLFFVAHEAAHFWLGQTVSYQYARDAWITEGGADLLAIRAVAEADPDYDPRPTSIAIEDCATLTKRRGVESARNAASIAPTTPAGPCSGWWPNPHRALFTKFVRQLLDANRADGFVTPGGWRRSMPHRANLASRDIAPARSRAPIPRHLSGCWAAPA